MNKIYITIFLVTFTIAGSFCGCTKKDNGNKNGGQYIVDMAGRKVWVPENVERIVCKGPGTLRLITYLQATDKVVGIEGGFEKQSVSGRPYRIAHKELTALPTIGTAGPSPQADSEAVLHVRPDVIFISYAEGRIVKNLQDRTEVPVVVLDPGPLGELDPNSVFQSLELAGNILGKKERAQKVIEFIKSTENELKQHVKNLPKQAKSSVYVGGLGYKGSHGITSTQVDYPGFELLDVNNIAGELPQQGHISVSKEKLLQWNPDVIFIDGRGLELILTDYQKNPKFYKSLKAVENNQVYVLLPYNFYTTNIGTALANYFYMGKVLYGSAFEDVNPAEKADMIYSFLVGTGVFEQMQKDYSGFKKLNLLERKHGEN
jgi:iron complex transport system substrate-binding protein